jgi:hypothetical protein
MLVIFPLLSKVMNEDSWQFIKSASKLGLLLQTSSHMTQLFSLMKSVISEVFDIAFA